MSKKKIRIDIGKEKSFDAEWNIDNTKGHTPINELIDWLTVAKLQGATHIDWHARASSFDGESEEVEAQPICIREEFDEEYNERIQLAKSEHIKANEEQVKKDMETWVKLKAKYRL